MDIYAIRSIRPDSMADSSVEIMGPNGSQGRSGRKFEFSNNVTPSVAVVEAISEATGSDPFSGSPLHEYVDTDALNELLSEPKGEPENVQITFEYRRYEVTIVGDGTVYVDRRVEPTD